MAMESNGKKADAVWRQMLFPKANNKVVPAVLRLAATLATTAAALVMGLNKQDKSIAVAIVGTTPIFQTITAKFNQTPAFVFFVIANAIASFYNLLVLFFKFFFTKCKAFGIVVNLTDLVIMALVATGAAAATSMAELGKHGNMHARWSPICDKFDAYCCRGGVALIASFVGAALLMILNALSVVTLYKSGASQQY